MHTAFRPIYSPGHSRLRRVIDPLVDPWTYARALHLLFMFPAGIAYFVALVTLLAVGLSLSWTIVGPPVLLVVMYLSRWAGDVEAWLVRHLHATELRRPPTTIERGSYRSQVWARVIDPTTWTGVVYLFLQFPIGIAAFVVIVTLTTVGGALTVSPLVVGPTSVVDFGAGSRWVIDEPADAWWLPFIGVTVLLVEAHLINLLSVLHGRWARLMLGSRAPHIVPGAPIGEPPAGPEGGPGRSAEPDGGPSAQPGPAPEGPPILAPAIASLTPREMEVLRLIARGYSNAEIAETFVVSEGTVKTHVKRILSKLEVRDRTQAVVWAYEHGAVEPPVPAIRISGQR